jgi:hypothetical protein
MGVTHPFAEADWLKNYSRRHEGFPQNMPPNYHHKKGPQKPIIRLQMGD